MRFEYLQVPLTMITWLPGHPGFIRSKAISSRVAKAGAINRKDLPHLLWVTHFILFQSCIVTFSPETFHTLRNELRRWLDGTGRGGRAA